MDIHFFNDPNQIPQPRDKIKIESLTVTPYPDRWRIYIEIQVTMFQERPNVLLVARNINGKIAGELDIIATMHAKMEFTMHLRGIDDPAGEYTLEAEVFYDSRNPPQDRKSVTFIVPEAESD